MNDLNIETHTNGVINIEGFKKYRKFIEKKQNLTNELSYFNINYLPNKLYLTSILKSLIKEVVNYRNIQLERGVLHSTKDNPIIEGFYFIVVNIITIIIIIFLLLSINFINCHHY
jgi:hypothetical protein